MDPQGAWWLDDSLVIRSPGSNECAQFLDCMLNTCEVLGIPLALDKVEGPSPQLTFLGIDMTTAEKLFRLRHELLVWQDKKSCTKKDLEHLIGVLQFASKVVSQGHTFVRRMINLLSVAKEDYHHICLNTVFGQTWPGGVPMRKYGWAFPSFSYAGNWSLT